MQRDGDHGPNSVRFPSQVHRRLTLPIEFMAPFLPLPFPSSNDHAVARPKMKKGMVLIIVLSTPERKMLGHGHHTPSLTNRVVTITPIINLPFSSDNDHAPSSTKMKEGVAIPRTMRRNMVRITEPYGVGVDTSAFTAWASVHPLLARSGATSSNSLSNMANLETFVDLEASWLSR